MRNFILSDLDACTGCQACVMACSFTKTGAFSTYKSRIYLKKNESEGLGIPIFCQHCEDPPCISVCSKEAILKDDESGLVKIVDHLCVGCGVCKDACPFGPETIKIEKRIAVKCDLCNGNPACVRVCQPGALIFVKATPVFIQKRKELIEKTINALISEKVKEAVQRC